MLTHLHQLMPGSNKEHFMLIEMVLKRIELSHLKEKKLKQINLEYIFI